MIEVTAQADDGGLVKVIRVREATPDDEPDHNSELMDDLNEMIGEVGEETTATQVSAIVSHLTQNYYGYSWRIIVFHEAVEFSRFEYTVVGELPILVPEEPEVIERSSRFNRDNVI